MTNTTAIRAEPRKMESTWHHSAWKSVLSVMKHSPSAVKHKKIMSKTENHIVVHKKIVQWNNRLLDRRHRKTPPR
jgi:hypothetical protein